MTGWASGTATVRRWGLSHPARRARAGLQEMKSTGAVVVGRRIARTTDEPVHESGHTNQTALKENDMTASYTFDVFSSLDGYGAASANWAGYWGKQGPELLDHRLALYGAEQIGGGPRGPKGAKEHRGAGVVAGARPASAARPRSSENLSGPRATSSPLSARRHRNPDRSSGALGRGEDRVGAREPGDPGEDLRPCYAGTTFRACLRGATSARRWPAGRRQPER